MRVITLFRTHGMYAAQVQCEMCGAAVTVIYPQKYMVCPVCSFRESILVGEIIEEEDNVYDE